MTERRVTLLLDDTALSRPNRVALAQADALIARGFAVRIVTRGEPQTWRSSRAEWIHVDDLSQYRPAAAERVLRADDERLRPLIIVDDDLYRTRAPRENEPLRVLLYGASHRHSKGVDDGYGAAAHARWFHGKLDLVRVSPWAPSREEPLDAVQEFHLALTTSEMTRLMHSCDAMLAPSWSEEPFDLPFAEALASGLVVVASDTEAHRGVDPAAGYALLAPERNAVELGERLLEVLDDDALRGTLRARAREVAGQWRAERVVKKLEDFLK
ncbi:MAG TPA: glycosyltransferase [Thermoanaerobaculia bacterium]|nr:glycosyltransferase [Thermoanaerobaculia bacterium]